MMLNENIRSILIALSLNIVSSCGTIFINKYLFTVLGFKFGTLLTCLHFYFNFLCCYVLWKGFKLFKPKEGLGLKEIAPIAGAFCGYVVFNNISLVWNSISFYQVMKLLCTPCIILIQYFLYDTKTSQNVIFSLIPVLLGVFITVFTDMEANFRGTVFALLAIGANALYTVWGKVKAQQLEANSMQILFLQSIVSAVFLTLCVPFFDDMNLLVEFEWNPLVILVILMSCCTAFGVNFSFFLMVGKTSPLTANVVGYFKTCLVFIGGIILFQAVYTSQNVFGVFVTLLGVLVYTIVKYREENTKQILPGSS